MLWVGEHQSSAVGFDEGSREREPDAGAIACVTVEDRNVALVERFIGYLRTGPMTVFGWYRLAAAAATGALVASHPI